MNGEIERKGRVRKKWRGIIRDWESGERMQNWETNDVK